MQFTVPQFIEKEAKIIGPLTFKQFIFIGVAGALCFILYFSFGENNLFLFILLAILIMGIAIALAFVKTAGQSLPTVIANFFRFSIGSKIYIWKKKEVPVISFTNPSVFKKEKEETSLKIVEKSRLKKIGTQLETKTK